MRKIAALLILATLFAFSYPVLAQQRSWGLSASLQQGELGINVPLWLGEKFVLAPTLGLVSASDIATDLSVGIIPKFYISTDQLSPYVALRLIGIFNSPASESENNKTDILAGIAFGGEYFFASSFSMAVEAQGNFVKSDEDSNRFGNPGGTNFNLAGAVTASIYFLRK